MTNSAEFVDFKSLEQGSHIDLETSSRHYQIEYLGGNAVRISGHPEFCPQPVLARLEEAVGMEGLELGLITRGMRLRFTIDDDRQAITTSKVVSVQVN